MNGSRKASKRAVTVSARVSGAARLGALGVAAAFGLVGCGQPAGGTAAPEEPEIGQAREAAFAVSTVHQCDLAGLGSKDADGVPPTDARAIAHSFPGVSQFWLDVWTLITPGLNSAYRPTIGGVFAPPVGDAYFGTGVHQNYAPVILGTDRGMSLVYKAGGTAPNWLLFLFGDTVMPPHLGRVGDSGTVVNDDVMGLTVQTASPGGPEPAYPGYSYPHRCVDLIWVSQNVQHTQHRFDQDPYQFDATTLDGYGRSDLTAAQGGGGYPLGALAVPGPGFGVRTSSSVADKVYVKFPDTKTYPNQWIQCSTTNTQSALDAGTTSKCVPGGMAADKCVWSVGAGTGICMFGPGAATGCKTTGGQPCFMRWAPSVLGVMDTAPHFKHAVVGTDAVSAAATAFKGRFSNPAVARDSASDSTVWVYGREGIWGDYTTGYKVPPYLMKLTFDPAHGGLQTPSYFKGTCGGVACTDASTNPDMVSDAATAAALYTEDKVVIWTTSVAYVPQLASVGDKKPWVMIYGGRIPAGMLGNAATMVIGPQSNTTVAPTPLDARYAWDQSTGVYMRRAAHPWGPWTAATTIYNPFQPFVTTAPNNAGFCSLQYLDSSTAPTGVGHCENTPASALNLTLDRNGSGTGAEYGADILSPYSESTTGGANIYWIMSTWNPYHVVLQQTKVTF